MNKKFIYIMIWEDNKFSKKRPMYSPWCRCEFCSEVLKKF